MKKQKGMTLLGLIFVGAVVIGVALVVMKVTPSVLEYFSVLKIVKAIAASGDAQGSPADIRKSYDRRAQIDDTPSMTGADLDISKEGGVAVISFAYEKKIPIAGNVSICIDYSGSSSPAKAARAD